MKRTSLNNIILFLFLVSTFNLRAQVIDKIIAKVDNEILLKSELEFSYIQFLAQNEMNLSAVDLKCHVFETLIINKLLLAKSVIDSVTVDRQSVDDQLNRRMEYFIRQVGGDASVLEKQFKKSVDELKTDLRKSIREQLIIQKMQDQITGGVKVTPGEVKDFYEAIPKDSLPYLSTEVEVGQIVKYPEIGKTQKTEAKSKLQEIKKRILAGEDFCKLAREYSEDPGSANECGELGWFKRGELVAPYEAAVLKLKPGEFSEVVESEFGFHLIQMIGRRANEFNSRHILIKPTSGGSDIDNAIQLLDSIRTLIQVDSISYIKAAKQFSDDRETKENGGFFIDQSGSTKIAYDDPIIGSVFFTIDTMQVGQISSPVKVRLDNGTEVVRIIYLKSKTPPHTLNLKDDYQKIYKAALEEKKEKELNKWFGNTKGEVFIEIDPEYKNCEILKTQ